MPDKRSVFVAELFKSAVEHPPEKRKCFLDQACADKPELRAEVEFLLRFNRETDQFLEKPAIGVAAESILSSGALSPGQLIGGYQIISYLAAGGMGEVYLAYDQKLERTVALKLLKFGAGGSDTIRHLQRERQILASLNHPHIGQLYDANVTAAGLSFIVMEYVEGTRIDSYCNEHSLSTIERLLLFRKVCSAVHYAHQHLVIHRDIKPSNILVTAAGEPKLLDFGVAKLLDPEMAMLEEQTMTLAAVMTPQYASPEQVRGEAITTLSDIYSLGVVLYELLTDQRPYRLTSRAPNEAARAISEQDPIPLSQRQKSLRGDLDNILLKALQKEPARRYTSVAQFSEDIRRHLEGLPVIARKDTFAYRSLKFVRRHKIGVAAAILVALSLAGGIVATAWQARKAREQARVASQERDRARLEIAKSERINRFLQDTLGFADPAWYSPSAGRGLNATIGDALKEASRRAENELADQPEVLAGVLGTLGSAYLSLGQFELADQTMQKALALCRKTYGAEHPETAQVLSLAAGILTTEGDYARAEELFQEASTIFRKHLSDESVPTGRSLAHFNDFALLKVIRGEPAAGEQLLREALKLAPKLSGNDRAIVAIALGTLGRARAAQGDLQEAEQLYRSSITEYNKLPGGQRLELASSLTLLGDMLQTTGDYTEAEADLVEAIRIARRLGGDNAQDVALASSFLATVLYHRGDYVRAEQAANESLRVGKVLLPEGHLGFGYPLTALGQIQNKTGRTAEGEQNLRQALAIREHKLPKGHWQIAFTKGALGECLMTQKRYAEAEPLLLESYTDLKKTQGEKHPRTIEAAQRLITFYDSTANAAAAQKYRALLPQPVK